MSRSRESFDNSNYRPLEENDEFKRVLLKLSRNVAVMFKDPWIITEIWFRETFISVGASYPIGTIKTYIVVSLNYDGGGKTDEYKIQISISGSDEHYLMDDLRSKLERLSDLVIKPGCDK